MYHNVRFSDQISYGSAGGPGYKHNIITQGNSVDEIVARQSRPRWRYNVAYGIKSLADLVLLQRFYIARRGVLYSFRFKDFLDFTSHPVNPSYTGAAGTRDQLIGTGTGSLAFFQLIKRYTDGVGPAITRTIFKPVAGTVLIWVNGVAKTEGVDYTVDHETGLVTMTSSPANGHAVEASFSFDVPVRFGREVDEELAATIDGYDNGDIDDIPLVEDLDPTVANVSDLFYGGSKTGATSAVDFTISPAQGRVWPISMTAASKSVLLPDPATLPAGQRLLTIWNDGANTFAVKDWGGATLVNLAAGQMVDAHIVVDGSSNNKWLIA